MGTLYTCSHRGAIPELTSIPEALTQDPLQTPLQAAPFQITENDITYTITPRFNYRLSGLVVSKRDHDTGLITSLHRRWQDHLNTADICLIWGENVKIDLTPFEFSSGQFTCFYKTKDRAAWETFDGDRLSNNHLLVQDDYLKRKIAELNIGDTITLTGWLSDYLNHETGSHRKTSIVRTDTGNGACETIWVTDIERLYAHQDPWHQAFLTAVALMVLSTLVWLWGTGTGRF